MTEPQTIYVKQPNPGMIAAILGCVFGVLGILTVGFIFFWLAVGCTLVALGRAATTWNMPAIGLSMLNIVLCVITLYTSPLLLVQIAWLAARHQQ